MTTIRSIHDALENLSRDQNEVVQSFTNELVNIANDQKSFTSTVQKNIQILVIADNQERYAALTRASRAANSTTDYAATVKQWTDADASNRAERQALDQQWVSRASVAEKANTAQSELSITTNALKEVSPELNAFDRTLEKIKAHNTKYPKAQITEENHDGFEKFKLGRALAFWLTFGLLGAGHRAYKIVSAYDKLYGDFYEDAQQAAARRENEKKLQGQQAAQQAEYQKFAGIVSRMDSLDSSYRGSEGIARDIRAIVQKEALASAAFATALGTEIKTPEAVAVGVAVAKTAALAKVAESLQHYKTNAQNTYNDLREPDGVLESALYNVGSESVRFSLYNTEQEVSAAANQSAKVITAYKQGRGSINAAVNEGGVSEATRSFDRMNVGTNKLELSFSSLKREVRDIVEAYEAEQRRLAAIAAAAAAEAERVRLAAIAAATAAANAAAAEAARQSSLQNTYNQASNDDINQKVGGNNDDIDQRVDNNSGGNDDIDMKI